MFPFIRELKRNTSEKQIHFTASILWGGDSELEIFFKAKLT